VAVGEVIARLIDGRDSRNFSSNRNWTRAGEVIDCEWYNSVLRTPEGRLVSILSLVRDVTERRRAEDHQRLMMRELDHRVKNNLAAVAGIAERTLDASASLDEFRSSFLGRIDAMSKAHGVLAQSKWTGVGLSTLVSQVLAPFTDRIDLTGPEVTLRAAEGTILAMVFHELGVNAAKYGALSTSEGRIGVRWRIEGVADGATLLIEWNESGGPRVQAPVRSGFGTEFIREAVSYERKGSAEIGFELSGIVCRLKVPLPSRRRVEPAA
jgi:two-component sensor histidine kinase